MLAITLFGQFRIFVGEQQLPELSAAKAQELFCYLLLHAGRAHHREALVDLLWGEKQQGKKYLRKTLWQLRKYLEPLETSLDTPLLLANSSTWLQINPQIERQVDACCFETVYQAVHGLRGSDLNQLEFECLCDILNLYRGDLLEGFYTDWAIVERERLREIYLSLASKLVDFCLANQQYERGVFYGKRILDADQVLERCHRKLMHLYYLSGNLVMAIRQYQHCKQILEQELSVQPSRATRNLYQQILRDQVEVSPAPTARTTDPRMATRRKQLLELQAAVQLRLHPKSPALEILAPEEALP